ncbi:PDR/VanB family oxidoreductase [Mycobacterium sp. 155]|uniref:PDR/VanB family oxidoreductase n=1 Tax=Mycobacterium sp. 155 TaxID=1157943 RepID=UPI00035DDF06|nr:PDR/VanB family oxidoreductase [Mycobacterium sp. 155]
MPTHIQLIIRERRDESEGVISLILQRPDGGELPSWEPGSHIDLVLDSDLIRQYSLSSDPSDHTQWRVGVLREPAGRGGSEFIFGKLHTGDHVQVSAPRNNFALESASKYLFIAGGIGITPILPMITQANAEGADWTLLYGGRTRRSMAFVDELARFGDRVTIAPQDEVGLLDIATAVAESPGAHVYACGPEPLLKAVEAQMVSALDNLHVERFAPKDVETSWEDEEFEVEFVDSGITVTVPVGRSILAVAEEAGVPVFSSCGEGTCGTCLTTIVSGRAEHRDSILSEGEQQEQTSMLICVSRAERGCPRLELTI